jgi:predicted amidophosphoribosyltransferase
MSRAAPQPAPPGFDACRALLDYDGAGRELVARLKYRNHRASLAWLATGVAALLDRSDVDAVTWIPTSRRRRQARGYDQAALLARAVGVRLRLPCRDLLIHRPGPPQTGRSADERRRGPAIAARSGAVPARLAVVDDVVTTGATMAAAARALRAAGAVHLVALAAARTSLKVVAAAAEPTTHGTPRPNRS